MSHQTYDVVIAGGGIAGAALGWAAQRRGARVLLVEPERQFRDRVRGENLHPWGVAELQRLGLTALLDDALVWTARYWDTHVGGARVDRRDLVATTPAAAGGASFHHPELQTALLTAAEAAGVEVRRGWRVVRVVPGTPAEVELSDGSTRELVSTQLAAIADGRSSQLRQQLAIPMTSEPSAHRLTGVLLAGTGCTEPGTEVFIPPSFDAQALMVPLTRARCRLYLVHPHGDPATGYSGQTALGRVIERCEQLGVPSRWLASATMLGPLATFDTTCYSLTGADLPPGIVLLGDAAGNVDPIFGCGMSLAFRDVRCLIDAWDTHRHWPLAAAAYLNERRRYHAALLRIERWLTRILYTPGPEGDTLRSHTLPKLAPLGIDLIGTGPDGASDDDTERALFPAA